MAKLYPISFEGPQQKRTQEEGRFIQFSLTCVIRALEVVPVGIHRGRASGKVRII